MKKLFISFSIFMVVSHMLTAQQRLDVEIAGILNNNGKIMLQLLDENEKVMKQEMSAINDKTCSFTFPDLKPGKYAVRYYHDENSNGRMETNLVGKPTEGYGFSNNVTGKFGPPPFEKWLFELKENRRLKLSITY